LSTTGWIAIIAALAALGGAGLTVLGNVVVGRMNRATQRQQLEFGRLAARQDDERGLRDGTAGRLRNAYERVLAAALAVEAGYQGDVETALRQAIEAARVALVLEPLSEVPLAALADLANALRGGDANALVEARHALELAARVHVIDGFQQPIIPLPEPRRYWWQRGPFKPRS